MPKRIPRQPEINIGTAGHVDHGKCLTLDDFLLFRGEMVRGRDLLQLVHKYGNLILYNENEELYSIDGFTYSFSSDWSLSLTEPLVYVQKYDGAILEIETCKGRRIKVTPSHPFFSRDRGWIRADKLKVGDEVAVFKKAVKAKGEVKVKAGSDYELANLHYKLSREGFDVEIRWGKRPLLIAKEKESRDNVTWDRVTSITKKKYSGYLIDLSVPYYHNFIAGLGCFISHNTTMVEALTGKWTSAHSEELRRGITIKVGYADAPIYECKNCPKPEAFNTDGVCSRCGRESVLRRVVSFVDCPGHESLMANTLSGAALMDGAILVIAANEPVPQPQTREHLQALKMIGIKNIVVVQNKIDLVSYNQALDNYERILDFLSAYGYADAPVIPISAQKGYNIDALIEAIEEYIPTPQRDESAPPLMQVLRSFDINKPGTPIEKFVGGVLGGSLKQGVLKVGDEIEIKPGIYLREKNVYQPVITKVVSLGTGAGLVDEVKPGGLIAVGTTLDPYFTKSDVMVGNFIAKPGILPDPVWEITMKTQLLEIAVGTQELVKVEKLKMNELLRLNVGTAVTAGVVTSIKDDIATVKLRRPVVLLKDSRIAISRRIGDRWRLIGVGVPA